MVTQIMYEHFFFFTFLYTFILLYTVLQKERCHVFDMQKVCDFCVAMLQELCFFFPVGVPVKVTNLKEGISKDSSLDIFLYLNDVG